MKTNKFLVVVVIAFSMFVSNAFALVKSPYPRQASPPDNNIVIVDDMVGSNMGSNNSSTSMARMT